MATSSDIERQRSISIDESGITSELELLKEIYINEFEIEKDVTDIPYTLTLQLHPATGENAEQQFVFLTLVLRIPIDYPESSPEIIIKTSRGLADEHINSLRESLVSLADERRGGLVLYELIEMAKESLTQSNIPHGECVICMQRLEAEDHFLKTECYHFFHGYCLLQYITHALSSIRREAEERRKHKVTIQPDQREDADIVCPVCRKPISYDLHALQSAEEPSLSQSEAYILTEETRTQQRQFSEMYEYQRAKGGIIDVEAEKNKFLIPSVCKKVPLPSETSLEETYTIGYGATETDNPPSKPEIKYTTEDSKTDVLLKKDSSSNDANLHKPSSSSTKNKVQKPKSEQVDFDPKSATHTSTNDSPRVSAKVTSTSDSNKSKDRSYQGVDKKKNNHSQRYFSGNRGRGSSSRYRDRQYSSKEGHDKNNDRSSRTSGSHSDETSDLFVPRHKQIRDDQNQGDQDQNKSLVGSTHRPPSRENRHRHKKYESYNDRSHDRQTYHADRNYERTHSARNHHDREKARSQESLEAHEKSQLSERPRYQDNRNLSQSKSNPQSHVSDSPLDKVEESKESGTNCQNAQIHSQGVRDGSSNQRRGRGRGRGQRSRHKDDVTSKPSHSDSAPVDGKLDPDNIKQLSQKGFNNHDSASHTDNRHHYRREHWKSKNKGLQNGASSGGDKHSTIDAATKAFQSLKLNSETSDDKSAVKTKREGVKPPPGFESRSFPASAQDNSARN